MRGLFGLKSKRLFYRILVSFLAMLICMFAIMFGFLWQNNERNYKAQMQTGRTTVLSTSAEYITLALTDLGRAMEQTLWNTDVVGMILNPMQASYVREAEAANALLMLEQSNPIAAEAYLLTGPNGKALDASGNMLPFDDIRIQPFFPKSNPALQKATIGTEDFAPILLTAGSEAALMQPFPTPEKSGAMLVILDMKALFGSLGGLFDTNTWHLAVYSADTHRIFPTVDLGDPKGTLSEEIFFADCGWQFRIVTENEPPFWKTGNFLGMLLVLAAVLLTVGAIMSLWITNTIYRPIRKLNDFVLDSMPTDTATQLGQKRNELEIVRDVYETTLEQKEQLTHRLAAVAPAVREKLYRDLLRGKELPNDYIRDRLADTGSPVHADDRFRVLVVGSTEENSPTNPAIELLSALLDRYLADHDSLRCEQVMLDHDLLALILAFPAEVTMPQIKKQTVELCNVIGAYTAQLSCEFIIGRGKVYTGIENLSYSFYEAKTAYSTRAYYGVEEEISAAVSEEQIELSDRIDAVLSAALEGDWKRSTAGLDAYFALLTADFTDATERAVQCDHLMDRFIEQLSALHVDARDLEIFDQYPWNDNACDWTQRRATAQSVAHRAVALLGHYGQRSRNRYVMQAKEYVREHVSDSMLSLDIVAEHVGINAAYLSRLFYETGGSSFVNFVNQCRVDSAITLLRQSRIPVRDIGFKTGFNSVQNFNRVFKKHTGKTPGAYRRDLTEGGTAE